MKTFSISPFTLITSICRNRRLLFDLAVRDTIGRYKGSVLGIFWSLLIPLMMLAIYTFVFGQILKARWGAATQSTGDYAIVLFAGLIVFNMFAECVSRAPALILANANFVTKIVFPLELLPCVNFLSALFHALVSTAVLLAFEIIQRGSVPFTAVLLPVVLLPFGLFILGFTWFLSATGVYLRDIGQTIGIFVTALMFMSPVFFPLSSLPVNFRPIAMLNPLTFPIEQARHVVVFGNDLDWVGWVLYTAVMTVVACLGFAWFQLTRKGFADVL